MGIVFKDDKPVKCDCGCIVYSGWVTEGTITVMHRGKPKTVVYTYCDEEGHGAEAMFETLYAYQDEEMHKIMTAEDKRDEYSDQRHDDQD